LVFLLHAHGFLDLSESEKVDHAFGGALGYEKLGDADFIVGFGLCCCFFEIIQIGADLAPGVIKLSGFVGLFVCIGEGGIDDG